LIGIKNIEIAFVVQAFRYHEDKRAEESGELSPLGPFVVQLLGTRFIVTVPVQSQLKENTERDLKLRTIGDRSQACVPKQLRTISLVATTILPFEIQEMKGKM
jgi:hypothetical protein